MKDGLCRRRRRSWVKRFRTRRGVGRNRWPDAEGWVVEVGVGGVGGWRGMKRDGMVATVDCGENKAC